jgi:hypothetical protein
MQKLKENNYQKFISKATSIHQDKYDYSKVKLNIIREKEKVEIICKIHGSFIQEIRVHLRGSGCRECSSDARRLGKDQFIKKAEEVHGFKYDYSKVKYINFSSKVEIICKKHGKFSQLPSDHLSNKGCLRCARDPDDFAVNFLKKAKKIHGHKYDYSLMKYIKSTKAITIICPVHGKFEQTPRGHLTSNGCYQCSGREKFSYQKFIAKSGKLHGDKYIYPKTILSAQEDYIKIICDIHGEFCQTPKNHMSGHGCPRCRPRTISSEKFIQKAKEIHQDKYDYSSVKNNLENDRSKIEIICRLHGSFMQEARVHLRGSGCRECFIESKNGRPYFIEKANKIYHNKYDYSLVNYQRSYLNIKIICPSHGIFEKRPNSHLKGQGCPTCSSDPKRLEQSFIDECKKTHKNKYDYSLVNYTGQLNEVIIICPDHGQFKQKPKIHINGFGCSKCSKSEKITNQSFVERSVKIHGQKYDYSKVNIANVKTKITIICQVHGEFLQTARNHLIGYGCFECNKRKAITTEEFIEKANKLHNFRYDYSKSKVKNTYTKVIIHCREHGEFSQTPAAHFSTKGCVKCFGGSSLIERKWIKSFNNENIIVGFKDLKINGKKLRPDGFDPTTNTVYEFYGDYWHGNPKKFKAEDINPSNNIAFGELYKRTIERANLIKSAGYKLISIWESDFKLIK